VIRAVHDTIEKLYNDFYMEKEQSHSSPFVWFQPNLDNLTRNGIELPRMSDTTKFVCSRISTLQRGGYWVVGSRLVNNEIMITIIKNCGTVDDVMSIFQLVSQEAQQYGKKEKGF
jgi:hypothetical protein